MYAAPSRLTGCEDMKQLRPLIYLRLYMDKDRPVEEARQPRHDSVGTDGGKSRHVEHTKRLTIAGLTWTSTTLNIDFSLHGRRIYVLTLIYGSSYS